MEDRPIRRSKRPRPVPVRTVTESPSKSVRQSPRAKKNTKGPSSRRSECEVSIMGRKINLDCDENVSLYRLAREWAQFNNNTEIQEEAYIDFVYINQLEDHKEYIISNSVHKTSNREFDELIRRNDGKSHKVDLINRLKQTRKEWISSRMKALGPNTKDQIVSNMIQKAEVVKHNNFL